MLHITCYCTWWRHQMETFSALLAICARNSPVPGEFPAQRPVTRSFDVFFHLRLNKRLSKQSWGWWFETLSCPLWRHRNQSQLDFFFIHSSFHKTHTKATQQHVFVRVVWHYSDVIIATMASQISSHRIVYSTVYSCADQRKHQSPASLAFVRGIHRWPVKSPHKGPVTRKMFPLDDVIMSFKSTFPSTFSTGVRNA